MTNPRPPAGPSTPTPPPGPKVAAVIDRDGDRWYRDRDRWTYRDGGSLAWAEIVEEWGPLTEERAA